MKFKKKRQDYMPQKVILELDDDIENDSDCESKEWSRTYISSRQ